MKKVIISLFSFVLLCSCSEEYSSDGFAAMYGCVIDTDIDESQIGAKKYTLDEFKSYVDGACFCRVGVYDFYKKGDKTYYVMFGEDEYGYAIFNALDVYVGCGIDIRQFQDDEMICWNGSEADAVGKRYNYGFSPESQQLTYGQYSEYVAFVNKEYLIFEYSRPWRFASDSEATHSREVFRRIRREDLPVGEIIDHRTK